MNKKFVGMITSFKWNNKKEVLTIGGFSYIEGCDISTDEKVKKSIILRSDTKQYVLKTTNKYNEEIPEYPYCGFSCDIDLGFIDVMKPLGQGVWNFDIAINCNGVEYKGHIPFTGEYVFSELKTIKKKDSSTELVLKNIENSLVLISNVTMYSDEEKKVIKKQAKKAKIKKHFKKYKKYSDAAALQVYKGFCRLPIKKDRVTFLTDSRGGLYGNFKYVDAELKRRGVQDIKYMLKPHDNMNKTVIEKFKVLYYIATSSAILLDDYYPFLYNLLPREGTKWVQLWHAPGAFKTFGFTRTGKLGWSKKPRPKNHRAYTHAIVSSNQLTHHYAEAYGISVDKIVPTGVPRTDVFFDDKFIEEKKKELYKKYPILNSGKKVILFAPTFRGKGRGGYYNFEMIDFKSLKENLSDEYVLIVKLHPFITNCPDFGEEYKDFIINLSHENEINDLLFISDMMITDYSSVCFEFSLLNRPMIFFAYDMEDYIAKRDFYYPYESFVPGPIVRNTNELLDIIKNNKFDLEKLNNFRNKFFDHFDGNSSKRVVDLILNK